MANIATSQDVSAIFLALFNSALNKNAMSYYMNKVTEGNLDISKIAAIIVDDGVPQLDNLGIKTDADFVDYLSENLLGIAKDSTVQEYIDGKAYWVKQLDEVYGVSGKGDMIKDFIYAALIEKKYENSDFQNLLINKLIASQISAEAIANTASEGTDPEKIAPFVNIMKTIKADSTPNEIAKIIKDTAIANKLTIVDDAKLAELTKAAFSGQANYGNIPFPTKEVNVDKLIEFINNGEETINYDTTTELTADKTEYIGTEKNDEFNAIVYLGNGTEKSTLTPLDVIDGAGGKNKLNVEFVKNNFAQTGDAKVDDLKAADIKAALVGVSNVQNLNLTSALPIETAGVELNGFDKINMMVAGATKITGTDAKEVSVRSSGNVEITAAKAEKVSVDTKGTATLTTAEAKEVAIKANGAGTLTNTAKVEKISVDLGDITNALTITAPLAAAKEVNFANLKLSAAAEFAEAKKLVLDKVDVADKDVTINKIEAIVANDLKGTGKLTTTATKGLDIVLGGKETVADLAAANLKNINIHANADKAELKTTTAAAALEKAVIDGSGKELTSDLHEAAALKAIDATAFSGNAKLTITNGAGKTQDVKLGGGDDILTISAALVEGDKLDGGAGNDALAATSEIAVGATDASGVTNFEAIKITDALDGTLDMSKYPTFDSVILAAKSAADAKVTNLVNNGKITIEKTALDKDVEINIKGADDGKQDVLNVIVNPDDTAAGVANTKSVVAPNIETINVTSLASSDKDGNNANTILLNTADSKDTLANITLAGDAKKTTLTLGDQVKVVKSVDATALKGALVLDTTGKVAAGAVVKGGAGDDEITFGGTTIVTGGEGKDKFILKALGKDGLGGINTTDIATITDFKAGDSIKLTGLVKEKVLVKYESSANVDFAHNLSNAITAAKADAKGAYFTYTDKDSGTTDTYIVSDDNGTVDSTNTYVVKLTGVVDLSAAKISDTDTLTLA